ncbi:transmembrane and coiled-coil domain-containing protein 4 isoform X2 [Engraulis encrasicolus]|uniref:transmembrane and coiled-coil domain-containing protein 4 isoform X2 n=1 Tax=Engraulis encrasicolus TaxID=184585 RepID=UPI002FCFF39F
MNPPEMPDTGQELTPAPGEAGHNPDSQSVTGSDGLVGRRLSEPGRFAYAGLCGVSLGQLFPGSHQRDFREQFLEGLVRWLDLDESVMPVMGAFLSGLGFEGSDTFLSILQEEPLLSIGAAPIIQDLVSFSVKDGQYDSRARVLIRHVCCLLRVSTEQLEDFEETLGERLRESGEESEEESSRRQKKERGRKLRRYLLIGLATVGGGTVIGVTGGLAAPLVAAGAGAVLGAGGAAALGSATGIAIMASLFGAAGAGLTGYKMNKRVGAIEEFEFLPLSHGKHLRVTVAVTGWLCSGKYSIVTAMTWPVSLLAVASVIDNPWSVCLSRSAEVGKHLAQVLRSRQQGKRPVNLIGFSLGARVIYFCLQELANEQGGEGVVEDVVLLGAPVDGSDKAWERLSGVVAGKIVNGYCRGDWLLGFLYRSSSVQMSVAGLQPISLSDPRIVNVDLSSVVKGHLDYMEQMETILVAVGVPTREGTGRITVGSGQPLIMGAVGAGVGAHSDTGANALGSEELPEGPNSIVNQDEEEEERKAKVASDAGSVSERVSGEKKDDTEVTEDEGWDIPDISDLLDSLPGNQDGETETKTKTSPEGDEDGDDPLSRPQTDMVCKDSLCEGESSHHEEDTEEDEDSGQHSWNWDTANWNAGEDGKTQTQHWKSSDKQNPLSCPQSENAIRMGGLREGESSHSDEETEDKDEDSEQNSWDWDTTNWNYVHICTNEEGQTQTPHRKSCDQQNPLQCPRVEGESSHSGGEDKEDKDEDSEQNSWDWDTTNWNSAHTHTHEAGTKTQTHHRKSCDKMGNGKPASCVSSTGNGPNHSHHHHHSSTDNKLKKTSPDSNESVE